MKSVGMNKPAVLLQMSTVTSCPLFGLSADDSDPTCFFPRAATILDGG